MWLMSYAIYIVWGYLLSLDMLAKTKNGAICGSLGTHHTILIFKYICDLFGL